MQDAFLLVLEVAGQLVLQHVPRDALIIVIIFALLVLEAANVVAVYFVLAVAQTTHAIWYAIQVVREHVQILVLELVERLVLPLVD